MTSSWQRNLPTLNRQDGIASQFSICNRIINDSETEIFRHMPLSIFEWSRDRFEGCGQIRMSDIHNLRLIYVPLNSVFCLLPDH